jgi:hypothetical protein
VIAAEEDVLAKNASTAASASSSSSFPAPVVSDRGEKVEQGKMTAMEKEVFTIMKTYVEHKMKKKRGGKGKKEAEVGKKLEIIEDQVSPHTGRGSVGMEVNNTDRYSHPSRPA